MGPLRTGSLEQLVLALEPFREVVDEHGPAEEGFRVVDALDLPPGDLDDLLALLAAARQSHTKEPGATAHTAHGRRSPSPVEQLRLLGCFEGRVAATPTTTVTRNSRHVQFANLSLSRLVSYC